MSHKNVPDTSGRLRPPATDGSRPTTALDDTERELAVLHAVLASMTAWERFDDGAELMLRELAAALGQMAAALWLPHGERLTPRAIWSMPSVDHERFERDLGALRSSAGVGLAGSAWERREAVDQAAAGVWRSAGAGRFSRPDGVPHVLAPTIAVPCTKDEHVLGVVELYSTAPAQLSSHLIEILSGAGRALGAFFARRRGELGLSPLSAREVEILTLAGRGHAVREIAAELTISPATVKTHLEHIYKKLGVRDRVAAVAHGLRAKIID
jgi:DNA-binding CsgD family transcriptional regulator